MLLTFYDFYLRCIHCSLTCYSYLLATNVAFFNYFFRFYKNSLSKNITHEVLITSQILIMIPALLQRFYASYKHEKNAQVNNILLF